MKTKSLATAVLAAAGASVVNMYCLGGTGINLAREFLTSQKFSGQAGYATIRVILVDVNESNIKGHADVFDGVDTYIIAGQDGSGGIRATNASKIAESIPALMIDFPASDYNILVSSGSGGTGSVILPHLAAAIVSEGKLGVAITILDDHTKQYALNTLNTLKSIHNLIGKRTGKTLPIVPLSNNPGEPLSKADQAAMRYMKLFSVFFSGQLNGLDKNDIMTWANQSTVTKTEAPVTVVQELLSDATDGLVVAIDGDEEVYSFSKVATSMSLNGSYGEPRLRGNASLVQNVIGVAADGDYTGLIEPGVSNTNLVTKLTYADLIEYYQSSLAAREKELASRVNDKLNFSNEANDDGMVL